MCLLSFKREFRKLNCNGYCAIEYGNPNTKLLILAVNNYPLAEQFSEKAKKSQEPSYNYGDCASFDRDKYEYPLMDIVSFNIRTFTTCDDSQPCELD